jgi:hypothetical protein
MVVDHRFGNTHVLYSTASLFYSGTIGSRDVIYLHGPKGQSFEVALSTPHPSFNGSFPVNVSTANNFTLLTFTPGERQNSQSVSDNLIIILSDSASTETVYAPDIPSSSGSTIFGLGSNETVLLKGPELLRNATISGSTLELFGDLRAAQTMAAYVPDSVTSISWNGQSVDSRSSPGLLEFSVDPAIPKLVPPVLSDWKYKDSLPEIQPGFDDSLWTKADHLNTTNPFFKYYGDVSVLNIFRSSTDCFVQYYLYACEYGLYVRVFNRKPFG